MAVAIPASIGRYQVVRPIREGGMGVVCLARDPAIDRPVAIKLLRDNQSPDLRARFMREARSAGRLRHPLIVTIYDVGEEGGQPFIAMEYIEGQTLESFVLDRTLPLSRKLELIDALCEGLHHAHEAGVVHRDVKPANVMVNHHGALKILDFGIARLGQSDMTQTGDVVGTLHYMAPEQMEGAPVDHRADIFSVGAVFYELLTSRRAFQGDLASAVVRNILYGEPEPLDRLLPGVDPRLAAIVTRCLEKAPADRYGSMSELRRDLAAVRRSLGTGPAEYAEELDATVVSGGRPSPEHEALMRQWLRQAADELDRGDLTSASVLVDRALSMHEKSPHARALRQQIDDARRRPHGRASTPATETRGSSPAPTSPRLLWIAAGTVILLAIGVAALLVERFSVETSSTPAGGAGRAVSTPAPHVTVPPAATPSPDAPAPPPARAGAALPTRVVPPPAAAFGTPAGTPAGPAAATPSPARSTPPPTTGPDVLSRTLNAAAGPAYSVSFSPSGREVAAGMQRGVVSMWDVSTGQPTQTLPGHVGGVWSVSFSPDARHLASRSGDQTIRVWDVATGKETGRLAGHAGDIWSLAYSPDGRLLASGSADGTVRIWDAATGAARDTLTGHTDWVTAVAFSSDGRRLVSGSRDRTIRVWDVADTREVLTLAHAGPVLSVAVSRAGQLIAAGAEDGTLRVWSATTGELRWSAKAHRGALWALAFKPDGAVLASGGADGLVKTWKTGSWEEEKSYAASEEVVRGVSFDARGQWLASAGSDGTVHLWRQ